MVKALSGIIEVTVLSDSTASRCEVACGTDWSSPEVTALADQRIKDRFGGRVRTTYIDLSRATSIPNAGKWREMAKEKNLPLPLLLVNGDLRIPGDFDIRQLLDVIEATIEMGK